MPQNHAAAFLCTGNSCSSQLAEDILRADASNTIHAESRTFSTGYWRWKTVNCARRKR